MSAGPKSPPRFLADDMVARLGRWLRVIGCDTEIWPGGSDDEMLSRAASESRVIVTRDTHLIEASPAEVGVMVVSDENPVIQLTEVTRRFHLDLHAGRYSRCQHCNGCLRPVGREEVRGEVPPRSWEAFDEFWRCADCAHLYWRGDHFESMERTLTWVERQLQADGGALTSGPES